MNVFTYGSLMFEEIWLAVTGRKTASVTGTLHGYAAWRIAGQTFPGLAPAVGENTLGRVWQDVTTNELQRLDCFEAGIYDRQLLPVRTSGDTEVSCWTYVVRPDSQSLLLRDRWDADEFRREHLANFMRD